MVNVNNSNVMTAPVIIRDRLKVPNGNETDGSIHYDIIHPTTDADLVGLYQYEKWRTVSPISPTDNVETAIEKLEKYCNYIEEKADRAQQTADTARREAAVAQSTADTARREAAAAQSTANNAVNLANAAQRAADNAAQAAARAQAAADNAQATADAAASSGGDFLMEFNIGGFVAWTRPSNDSWFATVEVSWNLDSSVERLAVSGAVWRNGVTQIPYQEQATFEIRIGEGDDNWIQGYSGGTYNVSFTAYAGSKSKTLTKKITIPRYDGEPITDFGDEPTLTTVTVGSDWVR